jgi:hypothetical protein
MICQARLRVWSNAKPSDEIGCRLSGECGDCLLKLPPREALDKISQRLVASRRAHDQRDTLRMAGEKSSVSRSALATKRELIVEMLKRAREERLGCGDWKARLRWCTKACSIVKFFRENRT